MFLADAVTSNLALIVHQPTRGQNTLDKIYVSDVELFDKVTVVASTVKSDHKAVVAHGQSLVINRQKTTRTVTFRKVTPAMHAVFLGSPLSAAFGFSQVGTPQEQYDSFYDNALRLLDRFYPKRRVTLTDRDPPYITPAIKTLLRLKNKLMRAGKSEKAGRLALQIGAQIFRCNTGQLARGGEEVDAREIWCKVRLLSRRGGGGMHATPGTLQPLAWTNCLHGFYA